MKRSRATLLSLGIASAIATILFAYFIARRITGFYEKSPPEIYAFSRVMSRTFKYAGRPVSITDETPGDAPSVAPANPSQGVPARTGQATQVLIRYGDAELRLPIAIPGNNLLPGLEPHSNWLKVLRFARFTGSDLADFKNRLDAGEFVDRLAIVTRTPMPGADPSTWGAAWKHDWTFDFYELLPQGGFQHERLMYPTTSGIRKPKPGELHENTWEFQAALQLMPQAGGIGPSHNFFGDALSSTGWLLPLGAFSGVICAFSFAFAFAPSRRKV